MLDMSDQSDRENIRTCPHCHKEFGDGIGHNEVNFKRHIDSCMLKQKKNSQKVSWPSIHIGNV